MSPLTWLAVLGLLTLASSGAGRHSFLPDAHARVAYSAAEFRAVESGDEAKIRDLREQEIATLRQTLSRRQPSNRRADLYFRLSELYIEAYRAQFILEGRVHDKRMDAHQEDKQLDRASSRPYLSRGLEACREIINIGIPYPKLDQIYYFMGFNYAELGNFKQSLEAFQTLIRRFPTSPYVGEAYRQLADNEFDANHYRQAQLYYLQALKNSREEARPRLLHRLAWIHYRLKEYDQAVSRMKEAVTAASASGEKFLNLRDEALRDLATFMTESGKVDEAISYFSTVQGDPQFYARALETLAQRYDRNVEPAKAVQVYEALIRTRPGTDSAYRSTVKLVDLDLRRGRFREALARAVAAHAPENPEPETLVAAQNLKAMVRRTATEHHESYRKKNQHADVEVAESFYTAYLNSFLAKDDPRHETPEIQMYLAEIKRDSGRNYEASDLYRKVIKSGDHRYAKEAAALWTASLADSLKKQAPQQGGKSNEPSATEREFVSAADQLQENLGSTNEGRESALRAAQVLAGYKSTHKDAVLRLKNIIEKQPHSQQGLTAARLWVQVLSDSVYQKNGDSSGQFTLEELRDSLKEIRANQSLMAADAELGQNKLKLLLADEETRLKIKAIAKEENDKDFEEAAKGYEALAADSSQRELSERAFANAVRSYAKARDKEAVERSSNTWLRRYPKSPRAVETLRSIATQGLVDGDFELAGRIFEKLGREGGDADSLETAARLYEGNGAVRKAQASWGSYLELYRSAPHRWSVALALARSEESTGDDSAAGKSYQYCMTGPAEFEAECAARLADLYMKNKDTSQARVLYRRVADLAARAGASVKAKVKAPHKAPVVSLRSPFVGYARFKLAYLNEQDAHFEALRLPDTQLKKALGQRLAFLEPLSRSYLAAQEAGGPWGIAALDRLALWAKNFADEVDAIEPPKSADAAGIVRFKKSLASISEPLRKKAIATWSDGYQKAVSAEVLAPVLPELADRLADANVPTPRRAQGPRGKFRLAGVPADGGSDGRKDALAKVRERLSKNSQDPAAWVDYGNLLWGAGHPLLAKIAYERGLALNARNSAALNNRAIVLLSGTGASIGEEDWLVAGEAAQLFQDALREDTFFIPAKMNRAALFNYYRLFAPAKSLWEQVRAKTDSADIEDGLGVALQGVGDLQGAVRAIEQGTDQGGAKSRFVNVYHDAARVAAQGAAGSFEKCRDRLDDLDSSALTGFEKSAFEYLKRSCGKTK